MMYITTNKSLHVVCKEVRTFLRPVDSFFHLVVKLTLSKQFKYFLIKYIFSIPSIQCISEENPQLT